GMVASSIYVASIPEMALAFGTSVGAVQLSYVGYLAALAGGMLVLGPLSDRYGRRLTICLGLLICVLTSLVCIVSPNVELLIAARVVQGFGACAGSVVGRAIVRDIYGRNGAAPVIAALGFAVTLVQGCAPVLGGFVQAWLGWRANFVLVTGFAVVTLALAIWGLPEPIAPSRQNRPAGELLHGFAGLLRSRQFLGYACIAMGAHAGYHIFAAGAPGVLINAFGVSSATYGFYPHPA